VLKHAGCCIAVAEDAEQVDKIAAVKPQLPALRLVVQTATHGMRQAELAWLTSFDAMLGDAALSPAGDSAPNEPALRLYPRSGSVRDVTLSHAAVLAAAETLAASQDVGHTDEAMAWMPIAWFGDMLNSLALSLLSGFTFNCPEAPETVWRDLREIGPTVLIASPRVWETMLAEIEARGAQATRLKRTLFAGSRSVAERMMQLHDAGGRAPLSLQLRHMLGKGLIHTPLRDQVGLRRVRWANTAGEPLSPRVLQGLRAFGIDLQQGCGMPELTNVAPEPAHA
jgi:long-chain acyl-CoA synthetase